MSNVRFAIVGTGYIAAVVAGSIGSATGAALTVISSRKQESADEFAAQHGGVGVAGVDEMLARDDVDAVYVATPTAAKEAITLAAIEAGRHVLVDKPFMNLASVKRMTQAAADRGVVFMDATHFAHHPRTQAIRDATAERLGQPRSLHSAFYFPLSERDNIRFDQSLEPAGALGDMAWYSMRAVVEYLRPAGAVSSVAAVADRDAECGAITRVSGMIAFSSGEVSTLDVGYTANTVIMDMSLYGSRGIITLDDFVLDWHNSSAFHEDDLAVGYVYRSGLATRSDFEFVATPSRQSQDARMIERFASLAQCPDPDSQAAFVDATQKTQSYLDALFAAVDE